MSEAAESSSKKPGWIRSKTGAVVIAAVAVATVFILIIAVMLSPSMSPLASVHDADGDGYPDSADEFPSDPSEWSDMDDDNWGDNTDEFPHDADEHEDSDGDGVGDNSDPFPEDSSEWSDMDDDGWGDNVDEFPHDEDEYIDSDDDGVGDNSDAFPDDPNETADSDGDGWGDNEDVFPYDPNRDSPSITYSESVFIDGLTVELLDVYPEFPWDDLNVTISTGSDDIVWEPKSEDLDGDVLSTSHEYETYDLGDIRVFLNVFDWQGDGVVSVYDWFGIYPEGGSFEANVEYTVTFSYEPTGGSFENGTFSFDVATPVTTISDTPITNGVKLTFGAVNADIGWDQISFLLSDGTDSGGWANLTADMLDDGLGDTQTMQTVTIGTLVVSFVIQDLSGNGKADQGDNIKLTAISFSSAVDYVFVAIYEPTDDAMAECTFTG